MVTFQLFCCSRVSFPSGSSRIKRRTLSFISGSSSFVHLSFDSMMKSLGLGGHSRTIKFASEKQIWPQSASWHCLAEITHIQYELNILECYWDNCYVILKIKAPGDWWSCEKETCEETLYSSTRCSGQKADSFKPDEAATFLTQRGRSGGHMCQVGRWDQYTPCIKKLCGVI